MRNLGSNNWVASLLGLAPELFEKCSIHLKARGRVTFFSMLIIHGFTTGTICYGLYQLYPGAFPIIAFVALFAVLFTADRLLITGDRHWSSTATRILLVVVLPLFNMAFFDLMFFDKDMRILYEDKQSEKRKSIKQRYDEISILHRSRVDALNQRNANMRDSIRTWIMLSVAERNGTGGTRQAGEGPIWEGQQKDIVFLQKSAEEEIHRNEGEINKLDATILENQGKMNAEIMTLPGYEQNGISFRLGLLYEKFKNADNPMLLLVSVAYFLFFLFVDVLLLLPAIYSPFNEYHDRVKVAKKQQLLLDELRDTQFYQLHVAEIQIDIERKLLWLQHEAAIESTKELLQDIEQQLLEELKFIESLQKEDCRIGERFKGDFERMARMAMLKSLDKLDQHLADKVN